MRRRRVAVHAIAATALPLALLVSQSPALAADCPVPTDQWEYVDLGVEGVVSDINNSGQIVGELRGGASNGRAFLWQDGQLTVLPTLGGYPTGRATGIDDEGRIAGYSEATDGKLHAFLWEGGQMRDLGLLGGKGVLTRGVKRGVVVGQVVTDWSTAAGQRAFRWQGGQAIRLNTSPASVGVAVNDAGQIAGTHKITPSAGPYSERTDRAFVWQGGVTRDLGTLGGNWSTAVAINDRGEVLGESAMDAGGVFSRGFVWSAATGMRPLREEGSGGATPADINDAGLIVGEYGCSSPYGDSYAGVWQGYDSRPLRLPDPGGAYTATPKAVNDKGEIAGFISNGVGAPRLVLWRPRTSG
ncbi:hypothetical protein [Nonomuraea sp. NPDC046570]|uniref:hypothetical protein n=1 Tax=Nonomuraea sp. NPDC046570 TaxID=3155255 RepID=UPI0033CDCD85